MAGKRRALHGMVGCHRRRALARATRISQKKKGERERSRTLGVPLGGHLRSPLVCPPNTEEEEEEKLTLLFGRRKRRRRWGKMGDALAQAAFSFPIFKRFSALETCFFWESLFPIPFFSSHSLPRIYKTCIKYLSSSTRYAPYTQQAEATFLIYVPPSRRVGILALCTLFSFLKKGKKNIKETGALSLSLSLSLFFYARLG